MEMIDVTRNIIFPTVLNLSTILSDRTMALTFFTLIDSITSRNSASSMTNVHTLSQNRYVFSCPLKLIRFRTRVASALLIARSN